MKNVSVKVILFLSATLLSPGAFSQKADTLFCSDEIVNIELKTDFAAIQKERTGEPTEHEGVLEYGFDDGKSTTLKVKVETRGYFRRDPSHCNFPPLMVNFKKNSVTKTLFENQDKLKLVTPCQLDHDVIDEYLIYKMYNMITDHSLNVRLAKVLYFDTGTKKKLFTGYSFFIEHEEETETRLNSVETKKFITPFDLDRRSYIKLVLFEYMIGNKDWFVTSRKNIITMQPSDSTMKPFALPYDFDLSGFVNAPYAKPEGVPTEYLTKRRVYKGLCFSDEEFTDAIDYFKSMRGRFEDIIKKTQLLPKKKRNENLAYLDEFYRLVSNHDAIIAEFRNVCETKKLYNLPE